MLNLVFDASLATILRHFHKVKYFPSRAISIPPLELPEGDYSVSLGWRLHYPQGPFTLRLDSSMNLFDVCVEVAKLFEIQYGIFDSRYCYPNSAVLIKPEISDEEILIKDYDDHGNEIQGVASTPFLEGISIDTTSKVIHVSLAT